MAEFLLLDGRQALRYSPRVFRSAYRTGRLSGGQLLRAVLQIREHSETVVRADLCAHYWSRGC